MWKPPSPQMTRGRRLDPNEAPTAAATECPMDAQTALQRNPLRPLIGRFAAENTPRNVSGTTIQVSSRAAPMRSKTRRQVSAPVAAVVGAVMAEAAGTGSALEV